MTLRISGIFLLLIAPALITGFQLYQSASGGSDIRSVVVETPKDFAVTDSSHPKRDYETGDTVLYEPALYMIRPDTMDRDVNISGYASPAEDFVFDIKHDMERYNPFGIEIIHFRGDSSVLFDALYAKPGISLVEDYSGLITLHSEPRETGYEEHVEVLMAGDY